MINVTLRNAFVRLNYSYQSFVLFMKYMYEDTFIVYPLNSISRNTLLRLVAGRREWNHKRNEIRTNHLRLFHTKSL